MSNYFSEFEALFNYKQQYTQNLKRFEQLLKDSGDLLELGSKCQKEARSWGRRSIRSDVRFGRRLF
jgi:hypothetical protein